MDSITIQNLIDSLKLFKSVEIEIIHIVFPVKYWRTRFPRFKLAVYGGTIPPFDKLWREPHIGGAPVTLSVIIPPNECWFIMSDKSILIVNIDEQGARHG